MTFEPSPLDERMRQLFAGSDASDEGAAATLAEVAEVIAGLAPVPPEPGFIPHQLRSLAELAKEPIDSPASLMSFVFGELAFHGNQTDYYNPNNSYLHQVLQRRTGIPISLAVVAVEIGRAHNIKLHAVGFPGHLLLTSDAKAPDDPDARWFDPFGGGAELDRAGCIGLLHTMYSGASDDDAHFPILSPSQVATRMLNNLKHIAISRGDISTAIRVVEIAVVLPEQPTELRMELAKLYGVAGRYTQAVELHAELALLDPATQQQHEQAAKLFRAHWN